MYITDLNIIAGVSMDLSSYVSIGILALQVILVIMVAAFGVAIIKKTKSKNVKTELVTSFASAPANSVQEDDDEIIAVIAAAVATMYDGTGKSAVIRSVRPSVKPNRSVWSAAGVYENTRAF